MLRNVGVPYGSRTRVAAVKVERFTVIQCNFAAWIALSRTLRTHGNCYSTLNGRAIGRVMWIYKLAMQTSVIIQFRSQLVGAPQDNSSQRILSPDEGILPNLTK